ncbi:MAG TPA: AmmeMemoRadiSam system protein B [Ignavibacteriaceae bacterium]|nr:AmmeMemoRadiSam system protein B [Ignavibacteriaceae bacterium]
MSDFRKPAVAGLFYSSNSQKLKDELSLLISVTSPEEKISNIAGIISPHAGYVYSGKTAAYGFNHLVGKDIQNVIIISPSHREYFPGTCIYSGDGYVTPLGKVMINKDMAGKIIDGSKSIFKGLSGHRDEHAIEVQVPFLQIILTDFEIIPIVMGDQSKIYVDELANQVAKVLDEKTIIIASSDLSHYHSKAKANELDSIVEKAVENYEFDKLQNYLDSNVCEACGGGPIVAMMKAASIKNKGKSKILNRSDSGDVSGDFNEVVGYLSAVIYGE